MNTQDPIVASCPITPAGATRPQKILVSLEAARAWSAADYLIQRKYDGEFATLQYGRALLLGELVRARSGALLTASDRELIARHGEFFAAFTVAGVDGESWLDRSTRERWQKLNEVGRALRCAPGGSQWTASPTIVAQVASCPAAVIAAGGEGVCAHAWDAPYGEMLAYKASEIYTVRVTATGATQSVSIADAATAAPRGNVPLRGGKCDRVRVGSILRVEGMGLTDKGLIRQPQPCSDWLVTY